jgi:hypothetical protein
MIQTGRMRVEAVAVHRPDLIFDRFIRTHYGVDEYFGSGRFYREWTPACSPG